MKVGGRGGEGGEGGTLITMCKLPIAVIAFWRYLTDL